MSTNDDLLELKSMFSQSIDISECTVAYSDFSCSVILSLSNYSESYLSHTHHVLKLMEEIRSKRYGQHTMVKIMTESKFIYEVLNRLSNTGSFKLRKTIFKKIYSDFFARANCHPLDPRVQRTINNITNFNQPSTPKSYKKEKKVHPLISSFTEDITIQGEKWQRDARIRLTKFMKWLKIEMSIENVIDIDVRRITPSILASYKNYLEFRINMKSLETNSAQTYIQTLRQWFKFLTRRNYIPRNPMTSLMNFHIVKPNDYRLLSLDDVEKFFTQTLLEKKESLKWYSLFVTYACMGVRATELLNVNRKDVNFENNSITLLRKGGREQVLPLPSLVSFALSLYIDAYPTTSNSPLWMNFYGNRLSYNSVLSKFHYFVRKAGFSDNVRACHSFRYLLFSELCYTSTDLETIRFLADHRSIANLNPYLKTRNNDVKVNFKYKFKTIGADLSASLNRPEHNI